MKTPQCVYDFIGGDCSTVTLAALKTYLVEMIAARRKGGETAAKNGTSGRPRKHDSPQHLADRERKRTAYWTKKE